MTVPARHPWVPATLNTRRGEVTVRRFSSTRAVTTTLPQGSYNSHLPNTHHSQLTNVSCIVLQGFSNPFPRSREDLECRLKNVVITATKQTNR